MGQVLTEQLAARFDPKLRVWWQDCTPDDPAVREKEIMTDCQAGAISVNEIRQLRGRKPWGPEFDEPVNMGGRHPSGDSGKGNALPGDKSDPGGPDK